MEQSKNEGTVSVKELLFGKYRSFAAMEAYKLLRTNVSFSFSAETTCPVIGVTSSLRGEGKSTTSINLAYTLAESGQKILLIEADMRLPSIPSKLGLNQSPGLSNVLSQGVTENVLQRLDEMDTLDILTAGDVPPNPSELLGSKRMKEMVETARERYNYIVVDLPPVTAVSDAVAITKLLDGILIVVRNDYAQKAAVKETLRQLSLVGVRVLGFVYTCAATGSKSYGKKYGRYGKKYGKSYGYGYDEEYGYGAGSQSTSGERV